MPLTADQVAAVGRAVKRTKRGIRALRGKGAARQYASRLASYRRDLAALEEMLVEPPPSISVKHNCWTCALVGLKTRDGYVYATCASPSADTHYWVTKQVLGEREMPLVDADNCPGWATAS